jgi:transcriptional regulator with XRE-family HTH domain
MELKDRIKQLRIERNWTQVEVASKLGFASHNAYNHWEKGKSAPSVRDLDRIANVFGVSVAELLFGDGAPVYTTPDAGEVEMCSTKVHCRCWKVIFRTSTESS